MTIFHQLIDRVWTVLDDDEAVREIFPEARRFRYRSLLDCPVPEELPTWGSLAIRLGFVDLSAWADNARLRIPVQLAVEMLSPEESQEKAIEALAAVANALAGQYVARYSLAWVESQTLERATFRPILDVDEDGNPLQARGWGVSFLLTLTLLRDPRNRGLYV